MNKNKNKAQAKRRSLSTDDYVRGILEGDRAILGRAISLIESNRLDHQQSSQELLMQLLPHTGQSHRVGISGVPGVGKSLFIETLGSNLIEEGKKVAVLAVDPSSEISGGSILGDKTRMNKLSRQTNAFIRPSPTSGSLGGVNRKTRETIVLCEAAGFDTILVETVGVGQNETAVANMVDVFLVLMLPGAGDELQGIKRGILELADLIAINKSDLNPQAAKRAERECFNALHLIRPRNPWWVPKTHLCSGLKNEGLDTIWKDVLKHRSAMEHSGHLQRQRQNQEIQWMWNLVEEQLLNNFKANSKVRSRLQKLESQLALREITPTHAATILLEDFGVN